jgi:hypothetical protein
MYDNMQQIYSFVCSFPVAVDDMGLGAFAASELDKVFLGYQPRLIADSPRRLYQIYSS